MKGKKRIVFQILSFATAAVLTAGALTGCGTTKSDKDEQGRTVVRVGAYPSQEGTAKNDWDAKWAKFEQDNQDIKIEPDQWAFDLKTFYSKAAGGQLPNTFPVYFTEVGQCIDAEYLADITSALKERGYEGKFNPKILDIVSRDGKTYAFPTYAYVLGLGYNTEMFEAAGLMSEDGTPQQPKTWDELVEFAVKIKEATGKPGFVLPTSSKNGGWLFSCVAWSFGVDFMEQAEDGKWTATFNTPEAVNALQWVKDLKWKYDVVPSNTLIDNAEYYKLFATGNAGMIITGAGVPSTVVKYGMKPEQLGMMALPAGPKRHVTLLGGRVWGMSENSTEDQIDAAIRWTETSYNYNPTDDFKTTTENTIKLALENNQLVGIKGMSVWSDNAESVVYENKLIDENANCNINHVKLYNEFVKSNVEIQPEEPVCAQELYGVLDGCIQEVLTNENADCAALIEAACRDFQRDYLDNLTY